MCGFLLQFDPVTQARVFQTSGTYHPVLPLSNIVEATVFSSFNNDAGNDYFLKQVQDFLYRLQMKFKLPDEQCSGNNGQESH